MVDRPKSPPPPIIVPDIIVPLAPRVTTPVKKHRPRRSIGWKIRFL